MQKIPSKRWQDDSLHTQLLCCAVQSIAHHWMLQRGEVHSNLMRAPGVELDLYQSRAVDLGERLPVRARLARIRDGRSVPGLALRGHARAMDRIAPNGQLDTAGHFAENALQERYICLLDVSLAKRFAQ